MDCSPPGFSVYGILQARILEWVLFPSPGDFTNPGIEPVSPMPPALASRYFFLNTNATWEAHLVSYHPPYVDQETEAQRGQALASPWAPATPCL